MAPRTRTDAQLSTSELLSRISSRPLPGPPVEGPVGPLDEWERSAQPPRSASADGPVSRRSREHRRGGRRSGRPEPRAEWLFSLAERAGVPPRAVLGLLFVGAALIAVLALRLVLLQHRSQAVPLRMTSSSSATTADPASVTSPPTAGSLGAMPTAVAGAARVDTALVHVVGEVRHPGVVRLPAGARVEQALDAAGGATGKADLVRVNLARPVVDGEQIVVPGRGETIIGAAPAPGVAGGGTGGGAGGEVSPGSPVHLNSASLEQLDALPGVGPVLAQRILDWRSQNGRFNTVDELGEVSGIGEKVLERLRPLVRL